MMPDPRDDEELIKAYFWLVAIVMILLGAIIGVIIHH